MVEEEYKSEQEDEYNLSENNGDDVFSNAAAPAAKPKGGQLRRIVLAAIGIFIVVLVVYKLLGTFFGPKKPTTTKTTQTTTKQVSKIPPIKPLSTTTPSTTKTSTTTTTSKPATTTTTSTTTTKQPSTTTTTKAPLTKLPTINLTGTGQASQAQVTSSLQSLADKTTKNQTAISKIEPAHTEIKTSITSLSSQLTTINSSLQMINQQLQKLSAKVNALHPRKTTRRARTWRKAPAKRTVYVVKAVIPGRAWLEDRHGNTLTVSTGDHIPGYGTVLSIDPQQGRVMTSSGATINYGTKD